MDTAAAKKSTANIRWEKRITQPPQKYSVFFVSAVLTKQCKDSSVNGLSADSPVHWKSIYRYAFAHRSWCLCSHTSTKLHADWRNAVPWNEWHPPGHGHRIWSKQMGNNIQLFFQGINESSIFTGTDREEKAFRRGLVKKCREPPIPVWKWVNSNGFRKVWELSYESSHYRIPQQQMSLASERPAHLWQWSQYASPFFWRCAWQR